MKKKIIIICSYTHSLILFRFDLLLELIRNSYEVYVFAPSYDEKVFKLLKDYNIVPILYKIERNGFDPISDLHTVKELRALFRYIKPDYILPYTVKPVIYSNLAKFGLPIKSVNWITGLGFYGMKSKDLNDCISKCIITFLYKIGIKKQDVIVFQNNDDLEYFKQKGILKRDQNYRVTPGSGVNVDKIKMTTPINDPIKFIFVGRLIASKGIKIFIEAALKLKEIYNHIHFIVVGDIDENNPDTIQKHEIENLKEKNIIEFTGHVNNVLDYVRESSVFVLPSMYREGIPRSILEALSLGRAIITTDNVGCRETVRKNYNGILIKKNNVQELVEAMEFFILNKDKIITYGKNSRKFAEEKFDVKIVNKIILDCIQ